MLTITVVICIKPLLIIMETSILNIQSGDDGKTVVSLTNLGIALKKSNSSWTIFCPALKVLGYSTKNERDALNDFEENLTVFFHIHLKEDSLHRALTKFNWNKRFSFKKPKFTTQNDPSLKTKDFEFSLAAA